MAQTVNVVDSLKEVYKRLGKLEEMAPTLEEVKKIHGNVESKTKSISLELQAQEKRNAKHRDDLNKKMQKVLDDYNVNDINREVPAQLDKFKKVSVLTLQKSAQLERAIGQSEVICQTIQTCVEDFMEAMRDDMRTAHKHSEDLNFSLRSAFEKQGDVMIELQQKDECQTSLLVSMDKKIKNLEEKIKNLEEKNQALRVADGVKMAIIEKLQSDVAELRAHLKLMPK